MDRTDATSVSAVSDDDSGNGYRVRLAAFRRMTRIYALVAY